MTKGMKVKALFKLVAWSIFIYLAYCGLLFLLQRQMMFPRGLIEVPSEDPHIAGLERIWIETGFGKVEAWFLPPLENRDSGPAAAVIFAHGNGELIDFWPEELCKFNRLGIGVLLVEYPGYGRSAGSPSQDSIEETFAVAYDVLVARQDVDAARIILFGRSLGGGAVCALAAQRPSSALILMSTFISARSFASRYLVPEFLVRDPFDNMGVVANYPKPILIMHGKFDEVIPYQHGAALYQAAQKGKMITYNSGHNDCPPRWDNFWQDVELFLREAGVI
ncbi:MAG: alpha/beta hydrolase [Proteobacteria bacterium]|nr:alpha/beta hydrolase [Pseudomonadota bacterium]